MKNILNSGSRYSIKFVQFILAYFIRNITFSNLFNLQFCKQMIWSIFASCHSSFLRGIRHVFGMWTNPQVVRPHTFWIVTFMKPIKTIWDFSMMKHQRKSVSKYVSGISSTPRDDSISMTCCSGPIPTRTEFWLMKRNGSIFIHSCPKSNDDASRKSMLCQIGIGVRNYFSKSAIDSAFRSSSIVLHSISSVDCLPWLRLFLQRGATSLMIPIRTIESNTNL